MKRGVYIPVDLPTCFVEFRLQAITGSFRRRDPKVAFARDLDPLGKRSGEIGECSTARDSRPQSQRHGWIVGKQRSRPCHSCIPQPLSLARDPKCRCVQVGVSEDGIERDRLAARRIRQGRVRNMDLLVATPWRLEWVCAAWRRRLRRRAPAQQESQTGTGEPRGAAKSTITDSNSVRANHVAA